MARVDPGHAQQGTSSKLRQLTALAIEARNETSRCSLEVEHGVAAVRADAHKARLEGDEKPDVGAPGEVLRLQEPAGRKRSVASFARGGFKQHCRRTRHTRKADDFDSIAGFEVGGFSGPKAQPVCAVAEITFAVAGMNNLPRNSHAVEACGSSIKFQQLADPFIE